MRKAVHPFDGVGSSNSHSLRGEWLCHHGDGVCKVVCAFCVVSQVVTHQSGSPYEKNVRQHNLKMRLMVLLFAPNEGVLSKAEFSYGKEQWTIATVHTN
jgi:hypothetical protein